MADTKRAARRQSAVNEARGRFGSRRLLALVAGLFILTSVVSAPASAQLAVFDPSVFGGVIENVTQGATQITNQVSQLQNQVTALKKLAHPSWRDLTGTLNSLNADFGAGTGVVYAAGNPTAMLTATYPGGRASTQYLPERATQITRALGTAVAVLAAAQHQARTFVVGLQQLANMKAQLGAIHGHEEALELSNSIALFQAGEALLSRQAAEAANNLYAVRTAQEVTSSAQPEANAHAWYVQLAVAPPHRTLISFRPAA